MSRLFKTNSKSATIKRTLALLLTLALVVGMLPISAFGAYEDSFAALTVSGSGEVLSESDGTLYRAYNPYVEQGVLTLWLLSSGKYAVEVWENGTFIGYAHGEIDGNVYTFSDETAYEFDGESSIYWDGEVDADGAIITLNDNTDYTISFRSVTAINGFSAILPDALGFDTDADEGVPQEAVYEPIDSGESTEETPEIAPPSDEEVSAEATEFAAFNIEIEDEFAEEDTDEVPAIVEETAPEIPAIISDIPDENVSITAFAAPVSFDSGALSLTVRLDHTLPPVEQGTPRSGGSPFSALSALPGQHNVSMLSGNYFYSNIDIAVSGTQPLSFSRTYNSTDSATGLFGNGWRTSLDYALTENNRTVTISLPDGGIYVFTLQPNGTYVAQQPSKVALTKQNGAFTFTDASKNVYTFDASGRLLRTAPRNGLATDYVYNGNNVTEIRNAFGALTLEYSSGKLTKVTASPSGRTVTYAYGGNGNLTQYTSPEGKIYDYSYDTDGRLSALTENGSRNLLQINYDSFGRAVALKINGNSKASTIAYDLQTRTTTAVDASDNEFIYEFDRERHLVVVTKDSGTTSYQYADGRVVSETNADGQTTQYAYDSAGNITELRRFDGVVTRMQYNADNLPIRVSKYDASGAVISVEEYAYDTRGNITRQKDASGVISEYTYDEYNNCVTSTTDGETTTFGYDAQGKLTKITDADGNVSEISYNAHGKPESEKTAMGFETKYEYDDKGYLIAKIDPLGNRTTYEVDANGRTTAQIDPLGNRTEWTYDSSGKALTQKDPIGRVTKYEYDALGNLITETDAKNYDISYNYDSNGRVTSMTDARSNTWTYNYDSRGFQTGLTDPYSVSLSAVYDGRGNLTTFTDGRGGVTSFGYDALGNVVQSTNAEGGSRGFSYDAKGNVTSATDENGNTWTYNYDGKGNLTQAVDPLGGVSAYKYDTHGRLLKSVSASGTIEQYAYDLDGRVTSVTDGESNVTNYQYDDNARLTRVDNADGTFLTYEYDAAGRMVKFTDANGAVSKYAYDKAGQLTFYSNAYNAVTAYTYDELGRTTSITDAHFGRVTLEYDANGNILKRKDAQNNVTSYQYDKLNRVVKITDARGGVTSVEYDANDNVTKVTNADGGITVFEYDLLDRLTSYTDAENNTFTFGYDANGNTTSQTDARNNTKSTIYDKLNRPVSQLDELGNASAIEYDADGRVTKTVNAEGAETSYNYDNNGNVLSLVGAYGNATTFTYDKMNRVATVTDANSAVTTITYDKTGNIAAVTDALGGVVKYDYDLNGNLIKETNELNKATFYGYDALNRPVSVTDANGHTERFAYDSNGQIVAVTDKNGNVTAYRYDGNGNVVQTVDANGVSAFFEYDAMNRLVKVKQYRSDAQDGVFGEEQITLYGYDKRGLVTKEVNALGYETSYQYDANGNLVAKTDADGFTTALSYDVRNIVAEINYNDGRKITFGYNKNGELVTMTDWLGTTSFVLDLLGQIKSVNDHNSKVVSYTYDTVGNQAQINYPDGTSAKYEYDLLGRMTTATDGDGKSTAYSYDKASQLVEQLYPNNWKERFAYDAAGQLTKKSDNAGVYEYWYDWNGNVIKENNKGKFTDYAYDRLNRLTASGATSYQYDTLGNLTYEATYGKTTDYKYNKLNQQVREIVNLYDITDYSFDNRGNLVEAKKQQTVTERYTYDATNRMTLGVNEKGESSAYIFNGLGYRVGNVYSTVVGNTATSNDGGQLTDFATLELNYASDSGEVNAEQLHYFSSMFGNWGGGYGFNFGGWFGNWWGGYGGGYNGGYGGGWWGGFSNYWQNNWWHGGFSGVPTVPQTPWYPATPSNPPNGGGGSNWGGGGYPAYPWYPSYPTTPTNPTNPNYTYKTTSVDYVIDYTSALKNVLLETENRSLTLRNTYGLEKISVKSPSAKTYTHFDRLGSLDFTTGENGRVAADFAYDAWGAPSVAVGAEYATHSYDAVLSLYFAEARMYDAGDRRFVSVDPHKGNIANPLKLVQYTYCIDNPLKYIDPTGKYMPGDENRSAEAQAQIAVYTEAWDAANAAGDSAAMAAAHEGAEAIRNGTYTASRGSARNSAAYSEWSEMTKNLPPSNYSVFVESIMAIDVTLSLAEVMKRADDWLGVIEQKKNPYLQERNRFGIWQDVIDTKREISKDNNGVHANTIKLQQEALAKLESGQLPPASYTQIMRMTYATYLTDSNYGKASFLSMERDFVATGYTDSGVASVNVNIAYMSALPMESITQEQHYFRNSLNIEYTWETFEKLNSRLPESMKWSTVTAMLHQNHKLNNIDNVKYVSADGHFEVVYNSNNTLQTAINNSDDMRTYNYYSPNDDWRGHYWYDMAPYGTWLGGLFPDWKWGNVP
jgi:RHS repeat-associated protein